MKVIVKCEKCGNEVEVLPVTRGNVAYWGQELREHDFYIDGADINVELLEDNVSDSSDVETHLKEVRLTCRKCGEYICLDCE